MFKLKFLCLSISALLLLLFFLHIGVPLEAAAKKSASVVRGEFWKQVDEKIKNGLGNEAFEITRRIYDQAKQQHDQENMVQALLTMTRIKVGLYEFEKAVKLLYTLDFPVADKWQGLLYMYRAYVLKQYYQMYSYDILKRKAKQEKTDFREWTAQQIWQACHKDFQAAWKYREVLGQISLWECQRYLQPGSFPVEVRPTVRDFLTNEWAGFLADQGTWTPAESEALSQLDVKIILRPDVSGLTVASSRWDKAHPLQKLVAIYADLYRWHAVTGRLEAALDARIQPVLMIGTALDNRTVNKFVLQTLKNLGKATKNLAWWSYLQYQIALILEKNERFVEAVEVARAGWEAHRDTVGGRLCNVVVQRIKAPEFNLKCELHNPVGKGRVKLTYRNLKQVFIRVYSLDNPLPSRLHLSWRDEDIKQILQQEKPLLERTKVLKDLGDYQKQTAQIDLELSHPGWYVVFASAKKDFSLQKNKIEYATYIVSEIGLIVQRDGNGQVQIYCVHAENGQPLPGTRIELYCEYWSHGRYQYKLESKGVTDRHGIFVPHRSFSSYLRVAAIRGQSISIDPAPLYSYRKGPEYPWHLFIYTDRAIYRPEQVVHFKVLAVSVRPRNNRYKVLPQKKLALRVLDPNGEAVAEINLKTNAWGSASGSFKIPSGRLLGNYTIVLKDYNISRRGGNFRVEEYKIPKFQVIFAGAKSAMCLDQPATIIGQAQYYFGGAVRQAKVKFEITRQPVFPWWYWWYRPYGTRFQTESVARGMVKTDEQGKFEIPFVPTSIPALQKDKEVTFVFRIKVSVTDEGGDTVSNITSYHVGQVSLKADIQVPEGYAEAGKPFSLSVRLTDLNNNPQTGVGQLKIFVLKPNKDRLPPKVVREKDMVIRETGPELAAMRHGKLIKKIQIKHDEQGVGSWQKLILPVGVYALEYRTKDSFGQTVVARHFIQVAPPLGKQGDLPVSLTLAAWKSSVKVGQNARFLISSGIPDQTVYFELQQDGHTFHRQIFNGLKARQVTYPVSGSLRGGFTAKLFCVNGYRLYTQTLDVNVPWDNKDLKVEFVRLRKILAPGSKETITLKIISPDKLRPRAEVLATLYDQALDYFVKHNYPDIRSLFYQNRSIAEHWGNTFQNGRSIHITWYSLPAATLPTKTRFRHFDYFPRMFTEAMSAKGRMKARGRLGMKMVTQVPPEPLAAASREKEVAGEVNRAAEPLGSADNAVLEPAPILLRRRFTETAFFKPHLVVDDKGIVSVTFVVPDSVTTWNLMIYAHGRNLETGTALETIQTKKDFMVRPYLPRFVREQDFLVVKTVIDNNSDRTLQGEAFIRLVNEQGKVVTKQFQPDQINARWIAEPGKSATVSFRLQVPQGIGLYKVQISARSGKFTDGEERYLPLLPSRMHLLESRFLVLKDKMKKTLTLPGLKASATDPSIVHESLVITVEGQLIYSLLKALPYLFHYPYECVEQTLNRFVCMALLHGTFAAYPALARMAKQFSKRQTPLETWDTMDPNRKLVLEETPWLVQSRGEETNRLYLNTLDPRLVKMQTRRSLAKLKKSQKSDGSFPWFPGGPPDFYMTLYVLAGLARAESVGVEVPRQLQFRALDYCAQHYEDHLWNRGKYSQDKEVNLYLSLFLNYVLSDYDRPGFRTYLKHFQRELMFKTVLKHWQRLSPYGRAMLALTLQRDGQTGLARRVLNSLLDTARSTENEGTYWQPESKSWLWYNDTIEMHAFILRTMLEIKPEDARTAGIALWLLRNKKGNQWKSTRATAEAITALVAYMNYAGSLNVSGKVVVNVPPLTRTISWKPEVFSGKQRVMVPPEKIKPESGVITLDKSGKGYLFASAFWQYSTEKLPAAGREDVLAVERKYYRIETKGRDQQLVLLGPSARIQIGDEVEVELTVQAKTPLEYVHLRDPRGAGFEPEEQFSGYRWDQLLGYYEEIRDSSTNFFFTWLPQGTFTFRYRLRAANDGVFRIGPSVIQSMYAPEFAAYSAGHQLEIRTLGH